MKKSNYEQSKVTSFITLRKSQLAAAVSLGLTLMSGSISSAYAFEAPEDAQEQKSSGPKVEVIEVTATRRSTTLQEIPYNISAVSGDQLTKVGATGLSDVVQMIPGLASTDVGSRQSVNNTLIMRGLNANSPGQNSLTQNMTDPSVSMYVNDIPMFYPISLSDIDRVEVLRGPQGTLYGSGSVGGTIRMMLNEADLDALEATLSAKVSHNAESDELNYQTDFIGNLPLTDDLAFRINAGYKQIGGVADADGLPVMGDDGLPLLADGINGDITTYSLEDTDEADSWYVRAAFLYNITDDVTATLNLMHQTDEGQGDTIGSVIDNDQKVTPWKHIGRVLSNTNSEVDVASLEVTADLGFATLTSATGHSKSVQSNLNDSSGLYGTLSPYYMGFPLGQTVASTNVDQESTSFTQELRLVSQSDGDWDWVVGAWYRDQEQKAVFIDNYIGYERWANDPLSDGSITAQGWGYDTLADFWADYQGVADPELNHPYIQDRKMKFEDIAVFGEVTYHINDDLQITAGARQFWQEFSQDNTVRFPVLGDGFSADQQSGADFSDNIFKVNASYKIVDDTMVYATWSQGFRHGGSNGFPTDGTGAVTLHPINYEADTADNYEIGLKGDLFDSQVRYTASAYKIYWDKPQLDVFLGALAVPSVINGDEAESQGVELEITSQLTDDLDMSFGYSYTTSELKGDDILIESSSGIVTAKAGDRLPGVPSHQLSLIMNYFVPLESGDELHFYYSGSYRDESTTGFNESFSSYTELDGFSKHNIGVNWNIDELRLGLFVHNLTNEEGTTGVRTDRADFSDYGYLGRPRSIGLSVSYLFE